MSSFLNPDGFEPQAFVANRAVLEFHESSPFRDTNIISIPYFDLSGYHGCADDDEVDWEGLFDTDVVNASTRLYWEGVSSIPFLLIAVLPAWALLCCLGPLMCKRCSCRKRSSVRFLAFCAYSACCLCAAVAWGSCFELADEVEGSLANSRDRLANAHQVFADVQPALDVVAAGLTSLNASVASLAGTCPAEHFDAVDAAVSSTLATAQEEVSQLATALPHLSSAIAALESTIPPAGSDSTGMHSINALLLAVTVSFWLATAIQYRNPGGATCLVAKRYAGAASCGCAFTVGIFFAFATLLDVAFAHGFATVGADVCAGNPDVTLQSLLAQALNTSQLEVQSGAEVGVCEVAPALENATSTQAPPNRLVQLLCFYQTCAGETSLGEALAGLHALAVADPPLPEPPADASAACGAALSAVVGRARDMEAVTEALVEQLRCSRINPTYTSLLHETVCGEDGLVGVMISGWHLLVAGALALLLALGLYRHFALYEPSDYNFRKVPKSGRSYWETTTNHADASDAAPLARGFHSQESQHHSPDSCGKLVDDGSFGVQFTSPAATEDDTHVSISLTHL